MFDAPASATPTAAPAHDRDVLQYQTNIAHLVGHLLEAAKAANPDTYRTVARAISRGATLELVTRWEADHFDGTRLTVEMGDRQVEIGRLEVLPDR